jgi:outer membrane biosynthesis protein TonB
VNQDLRIGWASSFTLHLLILLLAMVARIPEITRTSDFIEMQWGTISTEPAEIVNSAPLSKPPVSQPVRTTPTPQPVPTEGQEVSTAKRDIALPERRLPDLTDEVLSVQPQGEKLEASAGGGLPGLPERSAPDASIDPRIRRPGGNSAGERAMPTTSGSGEGTEGSGTGKVGSDAGYSVQWVGGGTRKRVSGRLPKYPEGTQIRAQVQIRAVVAPDGSVSTVTPIVKADRALEEAAMAELRLWKFEALRSNVPQRDQDCLVTFLFTLR